MKVLLILAVLGAAVAEDASTQTKDAFLLVSKQLQSMYAVEQMELVIQYDLFNVGDKPATKVSLNDRHSFPDPSFEIVKGILSVKFEEIPAGGNVSHSVIIKPLQYGVFNYTSAQVTYSSQGDKDIHVGYSNAPGEGYIYRLKEYERRFAPKYMHWLVFFALVAPTTIGSIFLYNSSRTKFEELAKKKI